MLKSIYYKFKNICNKIKKKIKNKGFIILLVILVISPILSIPLFLIQAPEWLDTQSGWIGFYGSYFSSIAAVVGIWMTIEHSKNESKIDRRLQHAPILKEVQSNNLVTHNTFFAMMDYFDESNESVKIDLKLKNVGLGPMIDMYLETSDGLVNREHRPIDIIQQGAEEHITVHIGFAIDYSQVDNIKKRDEYNKFGTNVHKEGTFILVYKDVLQNIYKHTVTVHVNSSIEVDGDKYVHTGSIARLDISKPQLKIV